MGKLLAWIADNKEWVFSGIGIAIVSALASFSEISERRPIKIFEPAIDPRIFKLAGTLIRDRKVPNVEPSRSIDFGR